MRIVLIPFFVIATLSACGGGDSDATESPPDVSVYVIKSRGAVQCTTPAMPLDTLVRQLTDAGVQTTTGNAMPPARPASCGTDGKAYPATCGSPNGQIGIFLIPQAQLPKALAAGFVLKSSEPGAKESDC